MLVRVSEGKGRLIIRLLHLWGLLQVVEACATMHAANVVHFDLKLQNVYIEMASGCSGQDMKHQSSTWSPFRVVLGDFGESKIFECGSTGYTMQPLGTDFFKSPEMLRNGQHPLLHRGRENFDRRRHKGAGAPSDVWSLGCLLYELVFGEMLFFDHDYMRFMHRICFSHEPVLPHEAVSKLQFTPLVETLVTLMTERNHEARIDVFKLRTRLDAIMCEDAAPEQQAAFPTAGSRGNSIGVSGYEEFMMNNMRLELHPWCTDEACRATTCSTSQDPRVVCFTPRILLVDAQFASKNALLLSAFRVKCMLVPHNDTCGSKHLCSTCSQLCIPCFFFGQDLSGAAQLLHICERANTFQRVLVVFCDSSWSLTSTVAVLLAMCNENFSCRAAMIALRRQWVNARFKPEHIQLLQQVLKIRDFRRMQPQTVPE